jgi:transcriptional regulator with XRE-family HTH domain
LFAFVNVYKSNGGVLVFYYNFVNLCNKRGISPSAAAEEMGYQRSVVTRWSKGTAPRQATIQKVADYFGVSASELTAGKKEAPALSEEDERNKIEEILNSLSREELLDLMAKTAEKLKERGLG